ncbi:MAG: AAA family ATPase [bacterium]
MKALYLDNLRGFDDTLIKFKDVNFLVGENSTGKTSILSLFRNSFHYPFWDHCKFPDDLQRFEDLVSINAEDSSHFTIGIYYQIPANHSLIMISTFDNDGGIPRLVKHTFFNKKEIIKIIFNYSNEKISYKSEAVEDLDEDSLFEKVRKIHSAKSKQGFLQIKKENSPEFYFPHRRLGITKRIIEKELNTIEYIDFFFISPPTWIAPIRAKPERTYDQYKSVYSPEGSHVPYRLNELLHDSESLDKKNRKKLLETLEEFGLNSGLFKKIEIKRLGSSNDKSAPFHLQVVLNEKPLQITNVGYGVAQVLPILVETLTERKNSLFAIQQPEVHLHPKAQASLGAYFYHVSKTDEKSFLIETHSDFLIDRYRREYALDKNKKESPAQVLFFKRNTKGKNEMHVIEIEPDGSYSANQPKEFREFFINEGIEMLNL